MSSELPVGKNVDFCKECIQMKYSDEILIIEEKNTCQIHISERLQLSKLISNT